MQIIEFKVRLKKMTVNFDPYTGYTCYEEHKKRTFIKKVIKEGVKLFTFFSMTQKLLQFFILKKYKFIYPIELKKFI